MPWTVANTTASPVEVQDVGDPQTIAAYGTAAFLFQDFLTSRTLQEQIGAGALCVVEMGDFAPFARIAPVTYPLHPSAIEDQDGESPPVTLAPFQAGSLYLNVTAVGASSSVAISFEPWDGVAYYPAVSVIVTVSTVGAVGPTEFFPAGAPIAGRFTWTITGSVTFALSYQVR